jgi:hypothetical protein
MKLLPFTEAFPLSNSGAFFSTTDLFYHGAGETGKIAKKIFSGKEAKE